jgi:predicted nucleotidyltransferase component of viral defense system
MQDLIKQEQFEIEVLDRLKSGRYLDRMIFGGGTMLRLCFGLDRYSIDLDFWLREAEGYASWFEDMRQFLNRYYQIRDIADKYNTLLVELKSSEYPRSLKLEMRKGVKIGRKEQAIAFSRFSPIQVYLRTIPLDIMMTSKIEAFLERKEIRDAYDLEFLVKKGVKIDLSPEKADQINAGIKSLTRQDYNVKLSSLLESDQRTYYRKNNFLILKEYLSKTKAQFV